MNNANISDNQKVLLCDELANIVHDLKNNTNIEAITMFYYKKLDKNYVTNSERIRINIIIKFIDDSVINRIEELNKLYRKSNLGVKLLFSYQFNDLYEDLDHYKLLNDLYNSTILFDRNGKYNNIKNILKISSEEEYKSWLYNYKNAIDTDLPIHNIRK